MDQVSYETIESSLPQDAFRSLLSQPRQGGESSRSRGTLGGARKDRFNRSKGKGRSAFEYVFGAHLELRQAADIQEGEAQG